jgi:hypothetical protein
VIYPAAPTTDDTIIFIAPAEGEGGINAAAAADAYGNPAIAVDSTNRTISVTFSPRLDEPIPNVIFPVGGVDGQIGPLDAGTWVFEILTNFYTFTVVAGSPLAPTATVEWHLLETGLGYTPPPSSFVISPVDPNTADTISFVAPAEGEGGMNYFAAADTYGNPAISVDSTNRTVSVTFSAPLDEPIPNVVLPVSGVDGQIGPLKAGTWVFEILTNAYTFNVAGPSLGITPAGNQVVISWTASGSNLVLQAATDLSTGNWSNVTTGITTNAVAPNGITYVFTNAVSSQAAYFRLKQQ